LPSGAGKPDLHVVLNNVDQDWNDDEVHPSDRDDQLGVGILGEEE
jgi:hypothetical protein